MKFLVILLLFAVPTTTFAQKIFIVTDEHNAPILGASVFLMGNTNELVAVSDEKGTVKLNLDENSQYLVHSLGYIDAQYNTAQLNETSIIILKESTYQLKEVKAGTLSSFTIKQPLTQKVIIDAPQDANKQRVTFIKIDSPGYLKNLKLFCKVQVKEVVPDYRFILLSEKNGMPDSVLVPLFIEGKKSKREIVFDLSKTNYYLEKGTYFIGYETFNGKAILKKQIHYNKNKQQFTIVPLVIYCSDVQKISYERTNLSKWYSPKYGIRGEDGKLIWKDNFDKNFAYELELLH